MQIVVQVYASLEKTIKTSSKPLIFCVRDTRFNNDLSFLQIIS